MPLCSTWLCLASLLTTPPPHTHPAHPRPFLPGCSYSPGAEVLLCYGAHTTLELLEVYGFLLDHNPHDTALLPPDTLQQQLQQAVAHHHTQQQQQAVGRRAFSRQQQQQGPAVELGVSAADCWLHANGQPSWQLLSQLR